MSVLNVEQISLNGETLLESKVHLKKLDVVFKDGNLQILGRMTL